MKRGICIFLSLCLLIASIPASVFGYYGQGDNGSSTGYVEGEAIVAIEISVADTRSRIASPLGAYETEELMTVSAGTAETEFPSILRSGEVPSKKLVLVKSTTQSTQEIIDSLSGVDSVEYAEPNYYVEPYAVTPDDPYYKYQWGNKNNTNGSDTSIPSVDANIETAWNNNSFSGSESPVVAVLDTGVDYTHDDLAEVMWDDGENIPELEALGGGKYGYSILRDEDDHSDPMDEEVGHGTHCASVIASQLNNGLGNAGGASPANAEIMAIRFMGISAHKGTVDGAIKGMNYILTAKKAGVNVVAVNNSWGPNSYDGEESRSTTTAVDALGEAGVISCFAAGNDSANNDANTGSFVSSPYTIRVGAMESQGTKSDFSNYGQSTVDVLAPGSQILAATTTKNVQGDPGLNEMPPSYLPQMMDASASYYYNNFESGDSVNLRVTDIDGNVITDTQSQVTGYMGGKATAISLADVEEDTQFAIELSLKKDWDYNTLEKLYIAAQFGFTNCNYGNQYINLQYLDNTGAWQYIEDYNGEPIISGVSDRNWNQLTSRLKNPSNLDVATGEMLNLRIVMMDNDDENYVPGKMLNKGDGAMFKLDDLGIGRDSIPYYYCDGTSMAAPMTVAVVTLVSQKFNPTFDVDGIDEVIARVKGGVNRERNETNDIANATVSKGYIDANAALSDDESALVPVLNTLTVSEGRATLTGYFFGESPGKITIGGEEITVEASGWTPETIDFDMPAELGGRQEVIVTTSNGNFGRDFFIITPDTRNYTLLDTADFDYTAPGDVVSYSSADVYYTKMAGADGKLLCYGTINEKAENVFEIYDIASDTWEQVAVPGGYQRLISLTGALTKFYASFVSEDGQMTLGIYNPAEKSWQMIASNMKTDAALTVYNNQLIAVGGYDKAAMKSVSDVQIINPDNGQVMGALPSMPQDRYNVEAMSSGSRLIVSGGMTADWSHLDTQAEAIAENGGLVTHSSMLVYDGNTWSEEIGGDFLTKSNEIFDQTQTINYALGATSKSLIAAGPTSGLGTTAMIDTWELDLASGKWSGRDDVLYSQSKTTKNTGTAYRNNFYVLSYTGRTKDPLIMRALAVETIDVTADPTGPKTPDPTPVNPDNPTGGGAKTGDTSPLLIYLALLLLAAGGMALLGRRLKQR